MSMNATLAPMREPLFRRLWFGNMSANLGTVFQSVGAAWLMMTMTGSPQMVALIQTSVTVPLLFLSLLSGVLADTFDRRRLMMVAQFFMFAVAASLAVMSYLNVLTPELLILTTLMIGAGWALLIPSWQASLRELVPREKLAGAIVWHSMGFNTMRSAGPAVGGALLAVAGAAAVFAASGVCYLVFAFVLSRWQRAAPSSTSRESLPTALLSGLRYSAMSPNLINVFARGTVFCALGVVIHAFLPIIAGDILDGGPVLFSILLGSFGIGAVAAAVFSTALRDRFSTELIVRGMFLLYGFSVLTIVLVPHVIAVTAAVFVTGLCWVLTNNTLNVTIQLSVPGWVAGRSISILHTSFFGGMTVGSLGWGALAESAGVNTALAAAAVLMIVSAFMGLFLPLPAISDHGFEPANTFREPEVKVDLNRHNGPITINIFYVIAPADSAEFIAVMKERRRIRRRDGALRWTLRRDVEHPDHWTETYTVNGWADYVRHNERRMENDVAVQER